MNRRHFIKNSLAAAGLQFGLEEESNFRKTKE